MIFSVTVLKIDAHWGFQTCQSCSDYVFPLSALTHCCFSKQDAALTSFHLNLQCGLLWRSFQRSEWCCLWVFCDLWLYSFHRNKNTVGRKAVELQQDDVPLAHTQWQQQLFQAWRQPGKCVSKDIRCFKVGVHGSDYIILLLLLCLLPGQLGDYWRAQGGFCQHPGAWQTRGLPAQEEEVAHERMAQGERLRNSLIIAAIIM